MCGIELLYTFTVYSNALDAIIDVKDLFGVCVSYSYVHTTQINTSEWIELILVWLLNFFKLSKEEKKIND